MLGIDLNSSIQYKCASFRYFEKHEHHIARFCRDNVLLLVFEGILRFSENEKQIEVHAGEYYIQKKNCYQAGEMASDAPKYLYVHFDAEWSDAPDALPYKGCFDHTTLSGLMKQIDTASHQNHLYCEQQYLFLKLVLSLKTTDKANTLAKTLAEFVESNIASITSLSDICKEFHYSKNYIERIFQKEFGMSPVQYINDAKIKKAMYLLEISSKPIGTIAKECGYADYPYFYKRFLHKTGTSPTQWRKMIHKDPLNRQ